MKGVVHNVPLLRQLQHGRRLGSDGRDRLKVWQSLLVNLSRCLVDSFAQRRLKTRLALP